MSLKSRVIHLPLNSIFPIAQYQVEKGETVTIFNVQSQNQNIFLVVETTCPLSTSRARPPSARSLRQQPPTIIEEEEDEEAAAAENDSHANMDATAIPEWLRNDFDDAVGPTGQQQQQQQEPPHSKSPQPPQPKPGPKVNK